jgi:hypothetical protein
MMLRRAAGSLVVSLLLWLAAVAGVSTSTPRARSSLDIDAGVAPGALVVRTLCVERGTITIGALPLDRRAHARWSSGALACAQRESASHARVRGVLLERPRAHVPHALRRTYDAHAPPRAIDFV